MSNIKIDLSLLKTTENDFKSEANNFNGVTYSTFNSSYLKSCSNNYVIQMAQNLESLYQKIQSGYSNIDEWWNDYISSTEELENSLASNQSATIRGTTISALYEYTPNLKFTNLSSALTKYVLQGSTSTNANINKHFIENWKSEYEKAISDEYNETMKRINGESVFIIPAEEVIKKAEEEIGTGEDQYGNTKYGKWASEQISKLKNIPNNGEYDAAEWCAIFVANRANVAGVSNETVPLEPYVPYLKNEFVKQGVYHTIDEVESKSYSPKLGDIIIYDQCSHTGLVKDYDQQAGIVTTIEGNTGSLETPTVMEKPVNLSKVKIDGFASPNYGGRTINPNIVIDYSNKN